MTANDIITAVSAVGFPVVMALILTWLLYNVMKDHKEETASLKDAIAQCTIAIQKLSDYIERIERIDD